MTYKEAAFILSDDCCDYSTEELRTAFALAIKALEVCEKNEKYGSELARIVAEHDAADELMKKAEEVSNGH